MSIRRKTCDWQDFEAMKKIYKYAASSTLIIGKLTFSSERCIIIILINKTLYAHVTMELIQRLDSKQV